MRASIEGSLAGVTIAINAIAIVIAPALTLIEDKRGPHLAERANASYTTLAQILKPETLASPCRARRS